MLTPTCLHPGCDMMGVIPGHRAEDDGSKTSGHWCFPHDPAVKEADSYAIADGIPQTDGPWSPGGPLIDPDWYAANPPPSTDFHIDVVNGLAAMILEHTAMTMIESDTATEEAMTSLAGNTAFTNDVAAAILLATTAICAAGDIGSEILTELAEVYERNIGDDDDQADDDDTPDSDGPGLDDDEHDGSDLDERPDHDDDDEDDDPEMTCPECDGTGVEDQDAEDLADTRPCAMCDGEGVVDRVNFPELRIALPADEQAMVDDLIAGVRPVPVQDTPISADTMSAADEEERVS
jgi:hypothetical protein